MQKLRSKTCNSCKVDKPLEDFHIKNVIKKDGRTARCIECTNRAARDKYLEDPKKFNDKNKQWYRDNIEYNKNRRIKYAIDNKDKIRNSNTMWRTNNRDYIREKRNLRRRVDPQHLMAIRLGNRLRMAIKKGYKNGIAIRELGCSIQDFKIYIESLFLPGMSWGNWSAKGWHLDHIKPLSLFNLLDEQERMEACHFTNIQPLWAIDNIRKGNKYVE